MNPELLKELIEDTALEDIPEQYREIVEITGIDIFVALSDYAKGDEIYFPKVERIIRQARNRRIKKEFNGYNRKELAGKYDLTIQQIDYILKDVPVPGQMDLFSLL